MSAEIDHAAIKSAVSELEDWVKETEGLAQTLVLIAENRMFSRNESSALNWIADTACANAEQLREQFKALFALACGHAPEGDDGEGEGGDDHAAA